MTCIEKYFHLTAEKKLLFQLYATELKQWNEKINLISRKDIANLCINHFLHSLSIAKIFNLSDKKVIDIGSGGGLPGIPLAIIFPKSQITLLDSKEKKTRVLKQIVQKLNLNNVEVIRSRSDDLKGKYDYIVARAVSSLPDFIKHSKHLLKSSGNIIYLKGGEFQNEIKNIKQKVEIISIKEFFNENFFEEKKIIVIKF